MTALDGSPHGTTETGAAHTEAAWRIAEENHPARLLGVAQVAIETALRSNNLAGAQATLQAALTRIKCPPCANYSGARRSDTEVRESLRVLGDLG